MEFKELMAFLAFGSFGAVIGLVVALFFRRRSNPYIGTMLGAFAIATAAGIMVVFVLGAIERVTQSVTTLTDAILGGLGAAFLLMFALPFVCGVPAALSGVVIQHLLQRRKTSGTSQPPPLPITADVPKRLLPR
jgi:hypothetical protein